MDQFTGIALPIQMPRPDYGTSRLRAEAPPRVHLAYAFLEHLAEKSSVHMAGEMDCHDGFNSGKGQELTEEEQSAQATALSLLSRYFAGTLEETKWDGVREHQGEKVEGPKHWNVVPCPACDGNPRRECILCGNIGKVKLARVE